MIRAIFAVSFPALYSFFFLQALQVNDSDNSRNLYCLFRAQRWIFFVRTFRWKIEMQSLLCLVGLVRLAKPHSGHAVFGFQSISGRNLFVAWAGETIVASAGLAWLLERYSCAFKRDARLQGAILFDECG